jgi:hypothetical protein
MTPLPPVLDSAKLIAFLKDCRMDQESMPERRYMYALGRNTLVDVLLVAAYSGEFDCDGDKE